MQGNILIVDAIATNRILFNATLTSAFYQVAMAANAKDSLEQARAVRPDLILLSMALPCNQAIELCLTLKSDITLRTIPVVMIAQQENQPERIAALKSGADDVISQPINDQLLLARIRSLLRAQSTVEELRLRENTSCALGFAEDCTPFQTAGRAALLHTEKINAKRLATELKCFSTQQICHYSIKETMAALTSQPVPDVFIIVLDGTDPDQCLHLLSDIRARTATRHTGIIVVTSTSHHRAAADALDLGANDLMPDGFNPIELALRLSTQMKRKRNADRLREQVRDGLQAAVTDPLTGLYNRRYATAHLTRIATNAARTKKPFAIMVADLDFFKQINDQHGHAAGDIVLVEVAKRLNQNLRSVDFVARIGGEEFLVVMPGTDLNAARSAARRLCREIEETAFEITGSTDTTIQAPLPITISIGVAIGCDPETVQHDAKETPEQVVSRLLNLADQALYAAKNKGRNCVSLSRTAA